MLGVGSGRSRASPDALKVVRTRDLEEIPPACLDVVHVQQPRRHRRDQSA
jgi:hypothetical protein